MRLFLGVFLTLQLLFLSFSVAAPPVALVVPEENTPESFDFIGVYLVDSVTRTRTGKSTSVPLSDTRYRVYSDGQEIRLYQAHTDKAFHSYKIYRSDGIAEENALGSLVITPGIQARHVSEDLLKQLSVTQKNLTITQFPPLSDTVVVIHAKRLEVGE